MIRLFMIFTTSVYAATIAVLSLLPAATIPMGSANDKLQHAAAYFLLALLTMFSLGKPPGARQRSVRGIALASAGCVGFGVLIECVQPLTGRQFDPLDMLANTLGVAAASAGMWVLTRTSLKSAGAAG